MPLKTIEYTLRGKAPYALFQSCLFPKVKEGITRSRRGDRISLVMDTGSSIHHNLLPTIRKWRQGVRSESVTFPTETKWFTFVDAVQHVADQSHMELIADRGDDPTTYLSLVFKFKGTDSARVVSAGRTDMPLPPFYFAIQIVLSGEEEGSRYVRYSSAQPFTFRGYIHPHTNAAGKAWGNFCYGGAGDQISSAIVEDDLTIFLDVFAGFLLGGTDPNDAWGSKHRHFQGGVERPTAQCHHVIRNELDVLVGAKVQADVMKYEFKKEKDHWYVSPDQSDLLDFRSPELKKSFYQKVGEYMQ